MIIDLETILISFVLKILISVPGIYLLHFNKLSSNAFFIILKFNFELINSKLDLVGDPYA